ncbi:MAG: hypothetical protein ACD_62C00156G0001 [uncultured bacterium]|nr:MAG: hypothetical protein ACD_62C00156G0001 [uncultured bacterium]HLD44445.1 30S ribosomal protein S18 [bacterium]
MFIKKKKEGKYPLKKTSSRRKACRFCSDPENPLDFRRPKMLAGFLTEEGHIIPRRMTGNCQFHQTRLVEAIKRARHVALLPYTVNHAIRD